MSNLVYPTLPGLGIELKRTPMHNTLIRESASRMEARATYESYPRYAITLKYEVLRAGSLAEMQTLVGFFNARRGAFDDFLYNDPKDNECADQTFGVGDGATTVFRLSRAYVAGGLVEPISATFNAPIIKKAGVVQGSGFTINANTGKVTFSSAPAVGQALSWSGNYYWRVRFAKDETDVEQFLWDLWKASKVELITVKTK